MGPASTLEKLLVDFRALSHARTQRCLSGTETARFMLLQDALLEAGTALACKLSPFPSRSPRVAMAVEVTFRTREGAARAMTRDVSTRGLCLLTEQPLAPGTVIALELHVPGWSAPLCTAGEVVWRSADAMGIALRVLAVDDEARLRELVAARLNLAEQVQAMLRSQPLELVAPERPAVRQGPSVRMALEDNTLQEAAAALLDLQELFAVAPLPPGVEPALLVADETNAPALRRRHPRAPLVLVNVCDHDALEGPLSSLRANAFVRGPVTASAIVEACRRVLFS